VREGGEGQVPESLVEGDAVVAFKQRDNSVKTVLKQRKAALKLRLNRIEAWLWLSERGELGRIPSARPVK
jgi:hypothetical protein